LIYFEIDVGFFQINKINKILLFQFQLKNKIKNIGDGLKQ